MKTIKIITIAAALLASSALFAQDKVVAKQAKGPQKELQFEKKAVKADAKEVKADTKMEAKQAKASTKMEAKEVKAEVKMEKKAEPKDFNASEMKSKAVRIKKN